MVPCIIKQWRCFEKVPKTLEGSHCTFCFIMSIHHLSPCRIIFSKYVKSSLWYAHQVTSTNFPFRLIMIIEMTTLTSLSLRNFQIISRHLSLYLNSISWWLTTPNEAWNWKDMENSKSIEIKSKQGLLPKDIILKSGSFSTLHGWKKNSWFLNDFVNLKLAMIKKYSIKNLAFWLPLPNKSGPFESFQDPLRP